MVEPKYRLALDQLVEDTLDWDIEICRKELNMPIFIAKYNCYGNAKVTGLYQVVAESMEEAEHLISCGKAKFLDEILEDFDCMDKELVSIELGDLLNF